MNRRINHVCYTDDDPDDHLIFSLAMNEILPDIGLYSFYNCNELIGYLKDENTLLPDIIFLDQNMPGNSGNECLKELKTMARAMHIPVVLYSTAGSPRLIEQATSLGAFRYVMKPGSLPEVKAEIMQLLSEFERNRS